MGIFFKRAKPRQFEYKPRYYDPEKEAREQRRRELCGEDPEEGKNGEYKPGQYIRRDMLARRGIGQRGRRTKSTMNVTRTVLALLCLGAIVLWILLT